MADAADPRLIAAHLAAAIIATKPFDKAKAHAPAAAKLYFDVLDAVKKEQDRRYSSPSTPQSRRLSQPLQRGA